ncbi:metallophosphoesterase [bacterium]|nr:metallophosphoesterase [bacterium]
MARFIYILTILLLTPLVVFSETDKTDKPSECVVIYGDSRTHHDKHRQVVEAFMQFKPKAVIHTGDLVHHGENEEEWKIFNQITEPVREKSGLLPARGNHDSDIDLYVNNFELPNNELWYSVDRNDIHFIFLDSNLDLSDSSEQYQWLVSDFRQNKAKFTSVILHHPLFTTGHHPEDEKGVRSALLPLFKEYGVDITFAGHNHQYERSFYDGIYHIVTGGGGAPLYEKERESPYSQISFSKLHFCTLEVIEGKLVFKAWDVNSEIIDSVIVNE